MDEQIKCVYKEEEYGIKYVHTISRKPKDSAFYLHSHNGYEILMILKGTADFVVEGTVYSIQPADIVMIHTNNMHRIYNICGSEYERIVISIDDAFFEKNNCSRYSEIFQKRTKGDGNLLDGETVRKSEILSTVSRLERYIHQDAEKNAAVVRCVLTELLHQMSEVKSSDRGQVRSETVKGVISYINENLGNTLSLDELSERFFISKYHLCKIFREYAGVTINQYIICKRLLAVQNMCQAGMTISNAAFEAGFSSYSAFYKAYVKENGCSPNSKIKKAYRDQ